MTCMVPFRIKFWTAALLQFRGSCGSEIHLRWKQSFERSPSSQSWLTSRTRSTQKVVSAEASMTYNSVENSFWTLNNNSFSAVRSMSLNSHLASRGQQVFFFFSLNISGNAFVTTQRIRGSNGILITFTITKTTKMGTPATKRGSDIKILSYWSDFIILSWAAKLMNLHSESVKTVMKW